MKKKLPEKDAKEPSVGQRIAKSLDEAIAWATGENVPVRVTTVHVPDVDVRAVRRKLNLSPTQFAARFGFASASVRSWEQAGRARMGRPEPCLPSLRSIPKQSRTRCGMPHRPTRAWRHGRAAGGRRGDTGRRV